jgi:GAF domain-containing protein
MEVTNTTNAESSALTTVISGALADLGPDDREMLNLIVGVARSILGAAASSIFLIDPEDGELVFEAVSGEGETALIGTRFPADRGIVGWVAATGEPITVNDLTQSTLFARDLAEGTGYVPDCILAVPVVYRQRILGVLEVLDPHPQSRASIADLDLLTMFAAQAGLALNALIQSRAAQRALAASGGEFGQLAQTVRLLAGLEPERRAAGLELFHSLHALLASQAL